MPGRRMSAIPFAHPRSDGRLPSQDLRRRSSAPLDLSHMSDFYGHPLSQPHRISSTRWDDKPAVGYSGHVPQWRTPASSPLERRTLNHERAGGVSLEAQARRTLSYRELSAQQQALAQKRCGINPNPTTLNFFSARTANEDGASPAAAAASNKPQAKPTPVQSPQSTPQSTPRRMSLEAQARRRMSIDLQTIMQTAGAPGTADSGSQSLRERGLRPSVVLSQKRCGINPNAQTLNFFAKKAREDDALTC